MVQTLRLCGIVMAFLLSSVTWAQDSSRAGSAVVVEVYNEAHLAPRILMEAENEVARIFALAGVAVELVNCGNSATTDSSLCAERVEPSYLNLRILARPLRAGGDVFGVAFLGEDGVGRYGDVFLTSAERLRGEKNVTVAALLGHVMAHEIGHLLLGPNAHSPHGIMRACWESEELKRVDTGSLLFTLDQQRRMQTRIVARLANREAAESVVSGSTGGR